MTDAELLKDTLARLGLSLGDASRLYGIPKGTLGGYTSGRVNVPCKLWRLILEHESRMHERRADIKQRAKTTPQITQSDFKIIENALE